MHRIAQFYKVSFDEFKNGIEGEIPGMREDEIREMYDSLQLPKRATKGSAGYDFYAPFTFHLNPGETIKIPTGIRVKMENNWVLQLYPRSGLGFKYRLQLNNTVGIIDSDYYNNEDNEGHIFVKLVNDSDEDYEINIGDKIVQGVFQKIMVTDDEGDIENERAGGMGSTGK